MPAHHSKKGGSSEPHTESQTRNLRAIQGLIRSFFLLIVRVENHRQILSDSIGAPLVKRGRVNCFGKTVAQQPGGCSFFGELSIVTPFAGVNLLLLG